MRGVYGTSTSCVEIGAAEASYILCDAGTGLTAFGNHVMRAGNGAGAEASYVLSDDGTVRTDFGSHVMQANNKVVTGRAQFHIFISHLHWDHIQGFPFFAPAYVKGNKVNIYGCHRDLKEAFILQQPPTHFPVSIDSMSADISFTILEPDQEFEIEGFTVKTIKQNHPGDSYGYRFDKGGKRIVYSTDSEHAKGSDRADYVFLDFFHDADLLICDAQYSFGDAGLAKENWGHSSNMTAVELSVKAGVKRLCIFHNDPALDDAELDHLLEDTRRYLTLYDANYPLTIDLAYDGLDIIV